MLEKEQIRERLKGFAIKPWERSDSDWNPNFVEHCLLARYIREFKKSHAHRRFASAGLD